jgi:hypothetical protein
MQLSPELKSAVPTSTFQLSRWGFQPYSALAAELNFCNEDANQCGSLSQAKPVDFTQG